MARAKELFLVWMNGDDEQYYNQYFSLTDAVASEGSNAEIFKADLTSLGSFELVTKLKKTKQKKKVA